MWRVQIDVRLVSDPDTETSSEIQFGIEEEIPEGFQDLDDWEQEVRKTGFHAMRKLFISGISLLEKRILDGYRHQTEACQWIRRGHTSFGISTVFGRVTLNRQRIYCKTCGKWVKPINNVLGLHEGDKGHSTLGLKALICLCAVNQPYRLAHKMIGEITQDSHTISVRHLENIVDRQGEDLRQDEEQARQQIGFEVIRQIQDRVAPQPSLPGRLYVCLDGILVRSHEGKGRWREGKVGLICTDERERIGCKGRQSVPDKRYVSSFAPSEIFGSQVYAQAVQMGLRQVEEVMLLGDGARWIRALHTQCFRHARYILDWYHLKEKVYQALKRTFPNNPDLRRPIRRYVNQCLWQGCKDDALTRLEQVRDALMQDGLIELVEQSEGLQVLIEYLCNNWDGIVDYQHLDAEGYLVASSLVEKAADLVIAKRQKKRQGMHWCHRGAQSLSALRTAWLNEDWDRLWDRKRLKNAS